MNPYHQQYAQTQTSTVGPEQLLLLMYEGAHKFLGLARQALADGQLGPGKTALSRAIAIIAELQNSLDHDAGWSGSQDLAQLYSYMIMELTQVNVSGEIARIGEVQNLLNGLYDSWREAIDSTRQAAASAPVPTETASAAGLRSTA